MKPRQKKILLLEELTRRLRPLREEGQTVALANGVFDLLHVGHLRYLEGAAELADVLVVAVNGDESARRLKGRGRPIIPAAERVELVAGLAVVDHVLLFEDDDVRSILRALKPDIHVKGTDYTPDTVPEREVVLSYGGRVAVAGDPKAHATSEIIRRLKGSGNA